MSTLPKQRYARLVTSLLAVWFLLVLSAPTLSIFKDGRFPVGAAAALSPILVFLIWFGISASFREFTLSLDVRVLTTLQLSRVAGFTWFVAAAYGILPKVFALPAAWGDVGIGLTAPLAALYLAKSGRQRGFIMWQAAGIAELAIAVTLGVLASPRLHLLGEGLTTQPLMVLPLSVIPMFGVPVAVILHIICIARPQRTELTTDVADSASHLASPSVTASGPTAGLSLLRVQSGIMRTPIPTKTAHSADLPVLIRPAVDADVDGILSCLSSAFQPYEHEYTPAAFEDTILTRDTLRARMKVMSVFVAVAESGEIVGSIACHLMHEGEGHLRGLAVDPRGHGRGISQQLLDRAESELQAEGCRRVTLDTTQYLQRAIRFYERNGYRRSGAVGDFFGMPLYEYVKHLV
jgi:ribosomal protein S18 acetylase RimI-like enzyme